MYILPQFKFFIKLVWALHAPHITSSHQIQPAGRESEAGGSVSVPVFPRRPATACLLLGARHLWFNKDQFSFFNEVSVSCTQDAEELCTQDCVRPYTHARACTRG